MQGLRLLIAVVVLAALGGTLYWSNKEKAKEATKTPADTPPKILSMTDADIQKLEIKRKGGGDTIVQRGNGGKWQLTAPQANGVDQEAANSLASAAATVASDRLVEDKGIDLKQYGLDAPSLELDLTKKDGKTQRLLVGDDAPGGSSTYAKLASDPRIFTIASYTKTSLDKSAKDLRDKRLLTFDQDKLSRIEIQAKKQDIEFGRSKDEWQILKPKPLRADGLQVEELVRKLKDAKMDLAVSEEDAKKAATAFASGTPVATVKVTDPSGTQEMQLRKKETDYYAKSSAADGVFKVASDLGTGLDKSVDDFRNKKLFDFGFTEPNKIEMHDGAKTYSFQKSGEKWQSNGKDMDSTSVQSLLDKLRDLSAARFVDTGLGTPTIDVTVTSNDGKRVEKVLISKGATNVAKRENEPALYELDSKTVDELEKAAGDVKPAQAAAKKK
ncbi:MAG: DUF4340 domain-containing protein [Bryobacteraceae bacterium]